MKTAMLERKCAWKPEGKDEVSQIFWPKICE